jgi:hypothetical protein
LIAGGVVTAMLGLAGLLVTLLPAGQAEGADVPKDSAPLLGMSTGSPTLLVWTAGGLPAGLAASARELPGVATVAEVRSGVRWLTAWAVAGNPAPSTPPAGFSFPIDVAAIDPEQYRAFLPPPEVGRFANLEGGSALMGKTGASLRGIVEQGALAFGDVLLPVQAVVEDELAGSHEAVVSVETGVRLGIVTPRYMLVGLARDASLRQVEERLRGLVPPEAKMRVRGLDEALVARHGGAVLPQAQLKKIFGEFPGRPGPGGMIRIDQKWVDENTVEASIPLLGVARCHKAIFPQLQGAFAEIVQRGLQGSVYGRDFGGCFSPRFLNRDPNAAISHHSWGVAFDINVSQNLFGDEPVLDPRVVRVLERWGFTWGGHWTVPDGMHFEYLRPPGSQN